MLEGLTLGGLLCSLTAELIAKDIGITPREIIVAINSKELPKNHHIQLAVRRAFLKASIILLTQYEDTLRSDPSRENYNNIQIAFGVRKRMQWPCTKSRWTSVPFRVGQDNIDLVNSALDHIATGRVDGAVGNIADHLTDAAIAEIVSVSSWRTCPEKLRAIMFDREGGWFPAFSAWIVHLLKRDTDFQAIQNALTLRDVQSRQQEVSANLSALAQSSVQRHTQLLGRLDRIERAFANDPFGATQQERAQLAGMDVRQDLKEILEDLPFGRRDLGTAAAQSVSVVFDRLTRFFAGRNDELDQLNAFVDARMDGGNSGLLIVKAPAGFGKSAIAAAWCLYASGLPERDVAYHFCSISAGADTTDPNEVLKNLLRQVAACYDETPDLSDPVDSLVRLLSNSPRDHQQLVVWLDGVDEAQGEIRRFLPRMLGERVCVIVSARANPRQTPVYLYPWIEEDLAREYGPQVIELEQMSEADVDELVNASCDQADVNVPAGVARKVYDASDKGYALFARLITEDVVAALKNGEPIELGADPHSLRRYADVQLEQLRRLAGWKDYEQIFYLLTVQREAMSEDLLRRIVEPFRVNLRGLPQELARWLQVSRDPNRERPDTVSFPHPRLAMVFRETITSYDVSNILDRLINVLFADMPKGQPDRLSDYALRHLPHHLIEADRAGDAAELIMSEDFIAARYDRFGVDLATDTMVDDWRLMRTTGLWS